jgi:hypothetical protein
VSKTVDLGVVREVSSQTNDTAKVELSEDKNKTENSNTGATDEPRKNDVQAK